MRRVAEDRKYIVLADTGTLLARLFGGWGMNHPALNGREWNWWNEVVHANKMHTSSNGGCLVGEGGSCLMGVVFIEWPVP